MNREKIGIIIIIYIIWRNYNIYIIKINIINKKYQLLIIYNFFYIFLGNIYNFIPYTKNINNIIFNTIIQSFSFIIRYNNIRLS